MLASTLTPAATRIVVTAIVVFAALAATGVLNAVLGRATRVPAVLRNVIGGFLAIAVTYGVGSLVGHAIG